METRHEKRDWIGSVRRFFSGAWELLSGHGLSQRISCIVIFACFALSYVILLAPSTRTSEVIYSGISVQMEAVADKDKSHVLLRPGETVRQVIVGTGDTIDSLSVELSFDEKEAAGMYELLLEDAEGGEIARYGFTAEGHTSPFSAALPVDDYAAEDGERLTLCVRSDKDNTELMRLTAVPFSDDFSYEGLERDGEHEDAVMLVSVVTTVSKQPAWTLALILIACVCPTMLFWRAPLAVNAFVLLLIFGLLFVYITPINDSPDEIAHMARTFHIVDGQWGAVPKTETTGADLSVYSGTVGQDFRATAMNDLTWDTKPDLGSMGGDLLSFGYLPQAAGVAFGRLCGMHLTGIYYTGRLFNMLFYALCAFLAIRMAPRFRLYMCVFAMLPMQVAISATYNSDGMLYALSVLAAGWFVRMYYERSWSLRARDLLLFMIPCVVIVIKQYWFCPIAFLPFVLPKNRFARPRAKWWCVLVAAVTLVVTAVSLEMTELANLTEAAGGLRGEGASVLGQLDFMSSAPVRSARILAGSLANGLGDNIAQLFVFGRLTAQSPELVGMIYVGFIAVVAFSTTRYQYDPAFTVGNTPSRTSTRIGVLIVSAVTVVAIYFSTYLTWTPVGVNVVMGVQGRYLIPVLAYLPFLSFDCWPLVTRGVYMRSRLVTGLLAVLMLTSTLMTVCFYTL